MRAPSPGSSLVLDDTTGRASEGDIVQLEDGSLLAAWTRFPGNTGDHAPTELVARRSTDGGQTWSEPRSLLGQHLFTRFGTSPPPFSIVGAASRYRSDGQTVVFDESGTRYAIYDHRANTWTRPNPVSEFGGGGLPFESIGAATYYRTEGEHLQLILFDSPGDRYVIYDESPLGRTWIGPFALSQLGGGGCPLHSIGAATFYRTRRGAPELILFDASGDRYVIYVAHSWRGPFAMSQFAGGTSRFARVGAAFSIGQGRMVLFDETGHRYRYYDEATRAWWDPWDPNPTRGYLYSPSFLRHGDRLAVYYLKKYFVGRSIFSDVHFALSEDEGLTWGPERRVTGPENEYLVLNNSRVARLSTGRIIVPVARIADASRRPKKGFASFVYYSDDGGETWFRSANRVTLPCGAEEPGVVEVKDGRLLMYVRHGPSRTDTTIYKAYSGDGGRTWGRAASMRLRSPRSPSTIRRLPNGDLVIVWNDVASGGLRPRNPLTVAISGDDGLTWRNAKNIESGTDPRLEFAYTSIVPVAEELVLSYYAYPVDGRRIQQVRRFPMSWLYEVPPHPEEDLRAVAAERGKPPQGSMSSSGR